MKILQDPDIFFPSATMALNATYCLSQALIQPDDDFTYITSFAKWHRDIPPSCPVLQPILPMMIPASRRESITYVKDAFQS